MRVLKFLIAGVIGVSVNLLVLRGLVILGTYYLSASIGAFAFATIVGFLLQKFWTFESRSLTHAHQELGLYVLVALFNLAINTGLVYGAVEYFHLHYLLAQFIGAGVVATSSFAVYHFFIFRSLRDDGGAAKSRV